jgi:Low-density lipoprotein receptor repeat class B
MAGAWRRVVAAGTGTVLAAAAVLAGAGPAAAAPRAPMLVFTPAPFNYGRVAVGKTASRGFTLANMGGTASGKLRVRLAGPAAFTITGGTCRGTSLKPGKKCTVAVRFAPASAAGFTATLTAAGKKHGATATDALTGTGGGLGQAPGGHIYWAAGSTIKQASLDGSSPHAVVTGQNHPFGVAVDGSHIYWATPEDRNGNPGAIWEANLDGTSPHAFIGGSDNPVGVAVDGSRIYWTDSGNGTINEANLDGSQPHILFGGQDGPASITVGS